MRVLDAASGISKEHSGDTLRSLYTPWGEQIRQSGTEQVWQEYPRPQLQRDNYKILNGLWSYWTEPVTGMDTMPMKSEILVPFSPETLLSGVEQQLQPDEYLWYEREIIFSPEEQKNKKAGMRCILHFEAVDYQTEVFCNGTSVVSHISGYLPFSADITKYVSEQTMLLQVRVRDESDTTAQSRGKQTLKRGGIFYTAQSGIWQSVWYEWVPANYIESMKITPNADAGTVTIELKSHRDFSSVSCTVYRASNYLAAATGKSGNKILPGERTIALIGVSIRRESSAPNLLQLTLPADDLYYWTPEAPYLYHFTIIADNDIVRSYFALRTFTVEKDKQGYPRFCLNHQPYFLHGILDQGYWPDGLMTAPCDEAFVYDINLAKRNGFNMIRKHIKVEPLRWYYHCDRLGMIVWQDMISGGSGYHMMHVGYLPTLLQRYQHTKDNHYRLQSRASEEGRTIWEQELTDMITHLYNVPSIAVWVPFNEGWGQFDAARIADKVKALDSTRPIDHASGWFDQGAGDFKSVHNYFRTLKVKPEATRAFVISEYGGYACHVAEHSSVDRIYGYKKFDTIEALNTGYHNLITNQLLPLEAKGLCGAVYTQLSDVEEEVNGLVTYDRRVEKIKQA